MRSVCLALVTVSVAATSTLSQNTNIVDQVFTNAPIVVSASRAQRTADEIPASVAIITAGEISKSGVQSVPEALEKLSGAYFRQYSTHPGQADISIRGFGENSHGRVLVLVDGQRLNNADMSAVNWLNVPVNSIERIEFLRGAQTALYGNYAVAGVINIITRDGAEEQMFSIAAHAGSDDTYGAHIGVSGKLGADELRYTADTDWQKGDGYRDNSGYESIDLRASITAKVADRLAIKLGAYQNWNDYEMPGSLSFDQMRERRRQTTNPYDEIETRGFGGNLGFIIDLGDDVTLDILLNAGRRDLNSRTPSFYLLADSQLNNFSFAPKLILPFELGGQKHCLIAGVDVHYDTLDYRTATMDYMDPFTNMPTWTVDADLKRWSLGGYLQQEIALSKKVSLILGGRIERCGFKSDIVYVQTPTNRSNESLVYNRAAFDASLIYRPAAGYKFYARAASIYRYPFLEEMASYTGYAPPSLNSSLRPEKGFHYEIGAAARPYRDLDIDVALYQINMKDEIAWDGSQNSNLDQARRRGLDAGITWKRQDVGLLSASYSLVDAEFTSGANKHCTVPLVPAQMLSLRGELELPADFTLLGGVKIVGKQRLGGDVDNSIPKMDDYTVVNVGLRYQPHQIKGLQLLFTIDNLFNQNYANMAFEGFPAWNIPDAYYPAAGRTWRFAASYKF